MIRVALIDDQTLVRTGFRMILESEDDFTIVGEAADGIEGVDLVRRSSPDVALMDIRMPKLDGVEATKQVRELGVATRVLILTTFDLDEYVYSALQAGASGFLLKDAPAESLIEAIRVIANGDALLAPSVTRKLIDQFASQRSASRRVVNPGVAELTEREAEVLQLMAKGRSNAEIAATLFLGETTVKTHVGRVLMKLGVRDRAQAVVAAYESGVVIPGAD